MGNSLGPLLTQASRRTESNTKKWSKTDIVGTIPAALGRKAQKVTVIQVQEVINLFWQGKLDTLSKDHPLYYHIPQCFLKNSAILKEHMLVFFTVVFRGILKSTSPINVTINRTFKNLTIETCGVGFFIEEYTTQGESVEIAIKQGWLVHGNSTTKCISTEDSYSLHQKFVCQPDPSGTAGEYKIGWVSWSTNLFNYFSGGFQGVVVNHQLLSFGERNYEGQLNSHGICVKTADKKFRMSVGSFKKDTPEGKTVVRLSQNKICQCVYTGGEFDYSITKSLRRTVQ